MDYGTLTYTPKGGTPQTFMLRLGSMTLGRAPENDVVLDDESVSRYHVRLLCTADTCWAIDLESTNGTFLNQVRLQPDARQPLRNGDTLRVGAFVVHYAAPSQTQNATPPLLAQAQPSAPPSPARPTVVPPDVAAKLQQPTGSLSAAPARRLRGNGVPPRIKPGSRRFGYERSSYLQYLPPCYHEDDFLGRFLLIFETILDPLERTIDQLERVFDPRLAPEPLLPWLAFWVDLVLNEKWPLDRRRALVGAAAELYRWRGTRHGLSEYIRMYTGVEPMIVEPEQEQQRGGSTLPAHMFRVILDVPDPNEIDRDVVEAIIETEKPAHTGYILEIRRADTAHS